MKEITRSERFIIREISTNDAPFILDLLNQPSFIKNIGDRQVRSLQDAVDFIKSGPLEHYATLGHGMWLICDATQQPIGMNGLLQREFFDVPDIGYAISESFAGRGIASETGQAVLSWAKANLKTHQILAMTSLTNSASENVLKKLGFSHIETKRLPGYEDDSKIFSLDL